LTTLPKEAFWTESQLIPYFQEIAFWLRDLLPQEYAEYFRYTAVESSLREIA
jgi:membrane protein required for colicin V production